MALQEFVNSPEFNRTSRNIADTGIKIFFRQAGAVISFLINFIKDMFRSILGK